MSAKNDNRNTNPETRNECRDRNPRISKPEITYKITSLVKNPQPCLKLRPRRYPSGCPVSLAFDASGALFIADFAHKSILSQPPSEVSTPAV